MLTPEWLDGAIWGGTITAAVILTADRMLVPWLARQKWVRIWDRKAARARRSNGSG